MNDALDAWEPFAIALLVETAKHYNRFVTYKQLGDTVQGQSGIRHDGLLTNWIGSLLGRSIGHGQPPLTRTAVESATRT
jgi:hypothetical protein